MNSFITGKALLSTVAFVSVLTLAGCGGSSTSFTEKDRVPDEDDHHEHDHGDLSGRLLISAHDDRTLHVLDLEEEAVIENFHLDGVPTNLIASPSHRFGVVVQGGDNGLVNFVDGGLYLEPHGDHFDETESDPVLLDQELAGDRPAHVTQADGTLAIFFDGNSGTPAQVQVFNEQDIEAAHEPAVLSYETYHQHGAAQPRGEYLLSTVRGDNADADSTLPDQVALFHRHDSEFEQEQLFDEVCPDLHGSAQNHDAVAFGCSDGVLLVEETTDGSSEFAARKLPFEERIGSLFGHESVESFVGVASGSLYRVTPDDSNIDPIDWSADGTLTPTRYAFAEEGELFLILDEQGGLTVLDTHDWEPVGDRLQVAHSETAVDDLSFELTTDGHFAFVTDPEERHLFVVDLEAMESMETLDLDFVPGKLTWLGIAGDGDDNHDDDHDHDH